MVHMYDKKHLRVQGGRYVIVSRLSPNELQLCARDKQGENVECAIIYERTVNSKTQMAFGFRHSSNTYLLGVNNNSLRLQRTDKVEPTDSDWFERISSSSGKSYNLRSVASPGGYLFEGPAPQRIFSLNSMRRTFVTHE